jgi:hypothetical protein
VRKEKKRRKQTVREREKEREREGGRDRQRGRSRRERGNKQTSEDQITQKKRRIRKCERLTTNIIHITVSFVCVERRRVEENLVSEWRKICSPISLSLSRDTFLSPSLPSRTWLRPLSGREVEAALSLSLSVCQTENCYY